METQTIIEAAFPWLTVMILVAALGALALAVIRPLRDYARFIALILSIGVLAIYVAALVNGFDLAQGAAVQLAETYSWIPSLGVSLAWGVSGVGAVMIALAVFLVPVVVLAGWHDMPAAKQGGYFAWILCLEAVMIALFAAQDVFLFYILFELMIVPMYFLIGRYGGKHARKAAMKFLLFSILGGLIMLVGVIGLLVVAPAGDTTFLIADLPGHLQQLQLGSSVQMLFFLSFFIGFAIKAPMWPLHTWLPDTAEEAPAGTSTLLVGVLDKLGTFGMVAICVPLFPEAARQAAPVIIVFALISIIWGALMAIASDNLMRLVAYTSLSHFGFMILGIFSGSSLALSGALLYMVAHGVATAALFLSVGFLGRRGESHLISRYGGWQRVTPVLAGTFLISGLATIALPGLSGFVPEFLVLMGTFRVNMLAAFVAAVGVVLAILYILVPYRRAFTGPKPDEPQVKDLDGREKFVMGVLIAAMLGLGLYPAPVLDSVNPVADSAAAVLAAQPDDALTPAGDATSEGMGK